ncbi:MAG: phosphatidate cytidylyltransferase [Xanthobacteraceae bacterium]|nr:MAG: phosphatidate cytidylyltransferase [Xanthobacteraceae bacterium]
MSDATPATTPEPRGLKSNLALRVMAALVLAPLALGAAWAGGLWWQLLAVAVGVGLFAEWANIIGLGRAPVLGVGIAGIAIAGACLVAGRAGWVAPAGLVTLAALVAIAPAGKRAWSAGGFVYALAALVAAVILRGDPQFGLAALLFVFAIVWATDILGYFVGRGVGGPRLWPRVSPKKTWSGALGGLAGSAVAAAGFALGGHGAGLPLVAIALALSVVSQAGDLFESAVKRRFGVKDSSHIIPGHGGLMDRLDGFIAVVAAAAIIGVARGGVEAAARGLMQW